MSTVLPTQVEVGLISHVFYRVPDHKWGAYTMHAAQHLTENGILIVTLKTVDSGCNQMFEHFGAPPYDLTGGLARAMRLHPEFAFSFLRAPASARRFVRASARRFSSSHFETHTSFISPERRA